MLTVVETQTLHDGEPMHWWEWPERTEGAQAGGIAKAAASIDETKQPSISEMARSRAPSPDERGRDE